MSGAFAGQRVAIVGAGASGRAAAKVLVEEGAEVWITERDPKARDEELAGLGVPILAGGHRNEHLEGATLVVTSPGVPESAEILRLAENRGLPVWSELELGARLCRVPYVAVTGTNGKTTTVELLASMMRHAGLDAVACGNVGFPFSLAAREDRGALAVEASSFQLRYTESLNPRVSVLLNVAQDHLDWHGSMTRYVQAKARIYARQREGDTHVGNREDIAASRVSEAAPCPVVWFRLGAPEPGEVGFQGDELIAHVRREQSYGTIESTGVGLRADLAAAVAAGLSFGLPPDAIESAIRSFAPLPHRGTVVAVVGDVRFVDDSKATNPHATLAALAGVTNGVLIAGGRSKGVDLSPLAGASGSLASVIAIGEAAGEIERVFAGHVPTERASSIEEAVRAAFAAAPSPGTVILAPACASQDMFRDYRERGERFATAAAALAKEVTV